MELDGGKVVPAGNALGGMESCLDFRCPRQTRLFEDEVDAWELERVDFRDRQDEEGTLVAQLPVLNELQDSVPRVEAPLEDETEEEGEQLV